MSLSYALPLFLSSCPLPLIHHSTLSITPYPLNLASCPLNLTPCPSFSIEHCAVNITPSSPNLKNSPDSKACPQHSSHLSYYDHLRPVPAETLPHRANGY